MNSYRYNLVTVLAVMFSLTACASCTTASDSPDENHTETIEPSTDSDTDGKLLGARLMTIYEEVENPFK